MIQEQIIINKLVPKDSMILTDGKIFGKTIFIGNDRHTDEFYEITTEEYEKIMKEQAQKESLEH